MKNLIRWTQVVLPAALLMAVACAKPQTDRPTIQVRGGPERGTVQGPGGDLGGITPFGDLLSRPIGRLTSGYDIQRVVEQLVSATNTQVGKVDHIETRFQVGLQTTDIQTLIRNNATAQVAPASSMGLAIFDEYAMATKSDEKLPPIVIRISNDLNGGRASGTVSPANVDVTFQDSYGYIRLRGQVSASQFWGTVSFKNTAGAQPMTNEATLGNLTMDTCGIFLCK